MAKTDLISIIPPLDESSTLGTLKLPDPSSAGSSAGTKTKHSVRFSEERDWVVVPSRTDIVMASMKDFLWYTPAQIAYFKKCADMELQCFMALSGDFEPRSAHACLYQPSSEVLS